MEVISLLNIMTARVIEDTISFNDVIEHDIEEISSFYIMIVCVEEEISWFNAVIALDIEDISLFWSRAKRVRPPRTLSKFVKSVGLPNMKDYHFGRWCRY